MKRDTLTTIRVSHGAGSYLDHHGSHDRAITVSTEPIMAPGLILMAAWDSATYYERETRDGSVIHSSKTVDGGRIGLRLTPAEARQLAAALTAAITDAEKENR